MANEDRDMMYMSSSTRGAAGPVRADHSVSNMKQLASSSSGSHGRRFSASASRTPAYSSGTYPGRVPVEAALDPNGSALPPKPKTKFKPRYVLPSQSQSHSPAGISKSLSRGSIGKSSPSPTPTTPSNAVPKSMPSPLSRGKSPVPQKRSTPSPSPLNRASFNAGSSSNGGGRKDSGAATPTSGSISARRRKSAAYRTFPGPLAASSPRGGATTVRHTVNVGSDKVAITVQQNIINFELDLNSDGGPELAATMLEALGINPNPSMTSPNNAADARRERARQEDDSADYHHDGSDDGQYAQDTDSPFDKAGSYLNLNRLNDKQLAYLARLGITDIPPELSGGGGGGSEQTGTIKRRPSRIAPSPNQHRTRGSPPVDNSPDDDEIQEIRRQHPATPQQATYGGMGGGGGGGRPRRDSSDVHRKDVLAPLPLPYYRYTSYQQAAEDEEVEEEPEQVPALPITTFSNVPPLDLDFKKVSSSSPVQSSRSHGSHRSHRSQQSDVSSPDRSHYRDLKRSTRSAFVTSNRSSRSTTSFNNPHHSRHMEDVSSESGYTSGNQSDR